MGQPALVRKALLAGRTIKYRRGLFGQAKTKAKSHLY